MGALLVGQIGIAHRHLQIVQKRGTDAGSLTESLLQLRPQLTEALFWRLTGRNQCAFIPPRRVEQDLLIEVFVSVRIAAQTRPPDNRFATARTTNRPTEALAVTDFGGITTERDGTRRCRGRRGRDRRRADNAHDRTSAMCHCRRRQQRRRRPWWWGSRWCWRGCSSNVQKRTRASNIGSIGGSSRGGGSGSGSGFAPIAVTAWEQGGVESAAGFGTGRSTTATGAKVTRPFAQRQTFQHRITRAVLFNVRIACDIAAVLRQPRHLSKRTEGVDARIGIRALTHTNSREVKESSRPNSSSAASCSLTVRARVKTKPMRASALISVARPGFEAVRGSDCA